MNKRTFRIVSTVFLAQFAVETVVAASQQCEVRGTWLNPQSFETATVRTETLNKIAQANLNTIFVATPPLNGNNGWSDADDFLNVIQAAKVQGLSVHVWVANKYRDDSEQVDFTEANEQAIQARWVVDLMAQYGDHLDGVHFDYIRYGDWKKVNIDGKMDGVTQTIERAYNNLKSQYPDKFLTATSFVLEPNWEESYKEPPNWNEDVPQWFKDWYANNPGSMFHGGNV